MTRHLFTEMDETPRHCLPLHLDPHTLARTSDPSTSHTAAREIVESGAGENQCQAIMELLRLRPATAKEEAEDGSQSRDRDERQGQQGRIHVEHVEAGDQAEGESDADGGAVDHPVASALTLGEKFERLHCPQGMPSRSLTPPTLVWTSIDPGRGRDRPDTDVAGSRR